MQSNGDSEGYPSDVVVRPDVPIDLPAWTGHIWRALKLASPLLIVIWFVGGFLAVEAASVANTPLLFWLLFGPIAAIFTVALTWQFGWEQTDQKIYSLWERSTARPFINRHKDRMRALTYPFLDASYEKDGLVVIYDFHGLAVPVTIPYCDVRVGTTSDIACVSFPNISDTLPGPYYYKVRKLVRENRHKNIALAYESGIVLHGVAFEPATNPVPLTT